MDQNVELLVFGYIRKHWSAKKDLSFTNITCHEIPNSIKALCVLFYLIPDDQQEEDNTILIRVCINKQYELTKDIDHTQDVWKWIQLQKQSIELSSVKEEIPFVFRYSNYFKRLFFNNNTKYEWKLYSYHTNTAEIEIEDNDDLQSEIDEFLPSDHSDDEQHYLKLRVIFFNKIISISAPKLCLDRIEHHYESAKISIAVTIRWSISIDVANSYPNNKFTFHIKENNKFASHKYVSCIEWDYGDLKRFYSAKTVLSPLDASTKYEFQIKMFDTEQPTITSPWSDPLIVITPSPPKYLPSPKYLQITKLLPTITMLRWDCGFAPNQDQNISFEIKEYEHYSQHPFVARYQVPTGALSPLAPSTKYRFTAYTKLDENTSMESIPIEIITPPNDWCASDYKPSPPINIEQVLDKQYDEINLIWPLPPNTFGDKIYFELICSDEIIKIEELPVRISLNKCDNAIGIKTVNAYLHEMQIILKSIYQETQFKTFTVIPPIHNIIIAYYSIFEIRTITEFNNQMYQSEPTQLRSLLNC
eukprot:468283_1